jgi:hypothetical protein
MWTLVEVVLKKGGLWDCVKDDMRIKRVSTRRVIEENARKKSIIFQKIYSHVFILKYIKINSAP